MGMKETPRIGVGIDTGGTYTDAVLLDLESGEILDAVKVPTTHTDLKLGVQDALERIFSSGAAAPEAVTLLSVSTTLATNAILEDRGAAVGFIAVGYGQPLNLPVVAQYYVGGGHTIGGDEVEALDLEALLEGVNVMRKSGVDTYAVCASMSMENSAHEEVAAKAIEVIDPKPVFCSHTCSTLAGFKERSATVVLNARLMPVMQRFTEGVQYCMEKLGISCDARIIRGDATHVPMLEGPMQAVSTVGSGPAATTWYGMVMGERKEALVVDVGGTSTDVTLLENGRPVLCTSGARIGEWDTHVQAVKMYTAAIGGDSHAMITKSGRLRVGPRRALPLCMAGEDLPSPVEWLGPELQGRCLLLPPDNGPDKEREEENSIVAYLRKNGPATPEMVRDELRYSSADMERRLEHLTRKQIVMECGFTPTDALHALGRLSMNKADNSLAGARALARVLGIRGEEVCELVLSRAQEAIEDAILRYMLHHEAGHAMAGILDKRREFKRLGMNFTLGIPILGVGAAARMLLPGVAESLGTEAIFPDYFEVGNALGALLLAKENGAQL